ncbi:MAG: MOSC domain-containing protein [Acidimicrobiia bacterium]
MHRSIGDLTEGLEYLLHSPVSEGVVEMIAARPGEDQRELLSSGKLDTEIGLVGDSWKARGAGHTADGSADRKAQLTLMNSRVIDLVAEKRDRWALAGDQLYVDLDLSKQNLPPGSRLQIGDAVIEASDTPHTGCKKFASRFGAEALRFVNTGVGRDARFRGVNTFVVQSGEVSVGDSVLKLTEPDP